MKATFLSLEREQNWQMAHSLWQAPRPSDLRNSASRTVFIESQNSPVQ